MKRFNALAAPPPDRSTPRRGAQYIARRHAHRAPPLPPRVAHSSAISSSSARRDSRLARS